MSRLVKQLLYGGAFLAIVAGIVWLSYRSAVPAPVCTDGIKNGKEEGVDCGAVCGKLCAPTVKPLENRGVQLIKYPNNGYDAVAHLENTNARYGALHVGYVLVVTDAAGQELARRAGTTYVNPLESRYLVFPLIGIGGQPASAELQLSPTTIQWGALSADQSAVVQFPVRREELSPSATRFHYQATATNRSNFDFDHVDITVLLRNSTGMLVGAGSTVVNTVKAGEERAFSLDWPFAIDGVTRAQAIVSTNLFDNSNYIRAYGSPESPEGF